MSIRTKFGVLATIAVVLALASSLRVISQEKQDVKRFPVVSKLDSAVVHTVKGSEQPDGTTSGIHFKVRLAHVTQTDKAKIEAERRAQGRMANNANLAKSSNSTMYHLSLDAAKLKAEAESRGANSGKLAKINGSQSELDSAKHKAEAEAQEAERRASKAQNKLKSNTN